MRCDASTKAATPLTIFFSYGHDSNRELVDRFKDDLERRGHKVWIDYKQIGIWEDWRGRITEGILDSDLVIAFLSEHSMRNPGVCRNEVAIALDSHAGMVYPILLEPIELVSPPVTITHLQWYDLHDWREIRDGKTAGVDWTQWYADKFAQLIGVLENEGETFHGNMEALRSVLQPLTLTSDIAHHIPNFVGREWLFTDYEHWLAHKKDSRLFWINAGPGTGKTAIASMLAHTRQAAVVGAWFCSYNSSERSNPAKAIRTLAYQIAARWPDYRRKLMFQLGFNNRTASTEWSELRRSIDTRSVGDLFSELLAEPLQGIIWRENRLVVVIDALDEATTPDGNNALADLIARRFAMLPDWIGFVITSRPESAVTNRLAQFRAYEIDTNDARNLEDLRKYLDARLSKLEKLATLPEVAMEELKATLLDRSEGMILYLLQALNGIAIGAIQPEQIDQLPKGLGSLYFIEFSHRFNNKLDDYDEYLKPLLKLILASPSPLPQDLACAALDWDTEHYFRKRIELGAFLRDSPEGIALFHKSLAEWLSSSKSSPFYANVDDGKKALANFLWRHFEESEYDFTYGGPFADQLYEWLPSLVDHADVDVSVDLLIDRYLEKIPNRRGLDAVSAFVNGRKSIRLAKSVMARAMNRRKDWSPIDRLTRLNTAAKTSPFSGDFDVVEYGFLRYLCEIRGTLPNELTQIRGMIDDCSASEPYYSFLLEGPYKAVLDLAVSACESLEQGILAAHYDGRVSALNKLFNSYSQALRLEYGTNFNLIATRTNALARTMEAQGDWGGWVSNLQSLRDMLQSSIGY